MMTQKDYKLFAKTTAEAYQQVAGECPPQCRRAVDVTVKKLCDAPLVDSERFNKDRFCDAVELYQIH